MFTRILAPIDSSADSLAGLPLARRLARATGVPLILLRVATAADLALGTSESTLAADVRSLAAGVLAEETVVRSAHQASEIPATIVAEARAQQADLIVMATHARSGLERICHPSIGEAVLATSPVPVLLVNAALTADGPDIPSPLLLAVDGTPEGALAVPVAAAYAQALGIEIALLRIVTPRLVETGAVTVEYDQAALDDAQHYVDYLAARLTACGVPAQGRAIFGAVAESIIAVAEQLHASMIALSTHSLRGIARQVHGSNADALLRLAPCPLLLVRRDARPLASVPDAVPADLHADTSFDSPIPGPLPTTRAMP